MTMTAPSGSLVGRLDPKHRRAYGLTVRHAEPAGSVRAVAPLFHP
jgi:hypothetical protein